MAGRAERLDGGRRIERRGRVARYRFPDGPLHDLRAEQLRFEGGEPASSVSTIGSSRLLRQTLAPRWWCAVQQP